MSDLSIAIDLNLSPEDNMHVIITDSAIEEIPKTAYRLGRPRVNQEQNTYYNTQIEITAVGSQYQGSDTHFYHRPDIGRLGDKVVSGVSYYTKPFPAIEGVDTLTEVCRTLGIMPSEFIMRPFDSEEGITHLISAKSESYLYTGNLAIRIGAEVVDDELVVVSPFITGYYVAVVAQ